MGRNIKCTIACYNPFCFGIVKPGFQSRFLKKSQWLKSIELLSPIHQFFALLAVYARKIKSLKRNPKKEEGKLVCLIVVLPDIISQTKTCLTLGLSRSPDCNLISLVLGSVVFAVTSNLFKYSAESLWTFPITLIKSLLGTQMLNGELFALPSNWSVSRWFLPVTSTSNQPLKGPKDGTKEWKTRS